MAEAQKPPEEEPPKVKTPAQPPPAQPPAEQRQLPALTKAKRYVFGYDPAKASATAAGKARKAHDKAAAKAAKNLAGPSVYADLEEMKTLCEKYRKGIDSLRPADAIELMKKIYVHLETGTLDADTTSSLYGILERLYLRPNVLAAVNSSTDPIVAKGFRQHPGMREALEKHIARSAAKKKLTPANYQDLARLKPEMRRLENDQIIRMARIIGKDEADPVAAITRSFGVGAKATTLPEQAALMLELNSKGIVTERAVAELYINHADNAIAALGKMRTSDAATQRVLLEIQNDILSGKVASADDAIVGIFKNEKLREDLQKILGPGSKSLLDELSKATNLKEMAALLKGVEKFPKGVPNPERLVNALNSFAVPLNAEHFINNLSVMGNRVELVGALQARRVLDSSTTEMFNAVRALSLQRAKDMRGLGPAAIETSTNAVVGGAKLVKFGLSPVIAPGTRAFENFAEAEVASVRPRKIIKGTLWTTAAVGSFALMSWLVYHFEWGKDKTEREEARLKLQKLWKVSITTATANSIRDSPIADGFFRNWFDIHSLEKLGSRLVPKNDKELNELLTEGGSSASAKKQVPLYVHPAWINELAAEVDAQIKDMKKQGKTDTEIKAALTAMVTTSWRDKGYFLTPGEAFIESFARDLFGNDPEKRPMIDYMKAAVLGEKKPETSVKKPETSVKHPELFTLLWSGIRDGSLPRTFAADVALNLYAIISDDTLDPKTGKIKGELAFERIKKQLEVRKAAVYPNLPSVRDTLAKAEITDQYLLKKPIPPGSLMDIYDQHVVASHDEGMEMGFKAVLEAYQSDENTAARLDAFRLNPDEVIYGDVPDIVAQVAGGTLTLDAARDQHVVADGIFARFNTINTASQFDEKNKGLIEFVYENSSVSANGKTQGVLDWLKRNAKNIRNAPKLIEDLEASSALFAAAPMENTNDKDNPSKSQLCDRLANQLIAGYIKEEKDRGMLSKGWGATKTWWSGKPEELPERWYVRTNEPFVSHTPRDIMPRGQTDVAQPTPVVDVTSAASLREKLGVLIYPKKNEATFSPQDKRVREEVYQTIADKAPQTAGRKGLAASGIEVKDGPVGLVISSPEPDAKEYPAFQKLVSDAVKTELATIAVEDALRPSVTAVLKSDKSEKPKHISDVIGAIAGVIVDGTDQENARLSKNGINVTRNRKGVLVVKVPEATENFQKLVKGMAAEVPK